MNHKEKQKHLEGRHFIKTARMSRGPCDIQEDTPQHQTSVEAPARNQAAGERIDFSKPFICVFSPPTHPCLDKDGPCNTQDKAPLPMSPLEAPACGQAAGKKSAFCKPFLIVFSEPKPCREVHVYGDISLDEDVFHQPDQKVSGTGASEMPAFQSVRKQKSRERHIQAKPNSGDVLQPRHKAVAPTQCQKAWKDSSSESFASIFSKDKQNDAGRRISQDNVPQPESPAEAPACSQAVGEKTAFSEHPIRVSTPSKHTRLDEDVFHQPHQKISCTGASEMPAFQPVRKRKSTEQHIQAKLNSGDALQHRQKAMALTQRQKSWKDSSSENFASISSNDKQNDAGRRISQDNVPQPESPVEAPACSQAAGEKSAFSEHPIRVSTPSKRTRLDEDEIKEMPVSHDSEQMENSSDYSNTYIPSHAPNNNEPCMSPVHGTDVRPMKIYYMHVQLKRGVAVLYHTKEGWEPPSKKIKMEEMTYIGKIHKNVPVYHMSEKKHLIAHEPMLDSRAQEKREEAHSPAQPPAQGGYPRAKTPECLVALDSGFRCMACCRVFPSLAILQDHVEYGVREGFSCHVFHNAMAHLKFKARKRRKKEKKEKALFRH